MAYDLQKIIENLGKPWFKIKRNLTIFRDDTNLNASSELEESIKEALTESEFFILLASPGVSSSLWINKELEFWLTLRKSPQNNSNIIIIVLQGDIIWDNDAKDFDYNKTNCLPQGLKSIFINEPLWIDLRAHVNINNNSFYKSNEVIREETAKVVATLTNKSPREIISYESKRRKILIVYSFLLSLFIISLLITAIYFQYKNNIISKIALVNQKNTLTNSILAEANKLTELNKNKALFLYAKAYFISPSETTFKILTDFYNENTILESGDTLNVFYNKVKEREIEKVDSEKYAFDCTYNESYSDSIVKYYKKVNLLFTNNTYFILSNDQIHFFSLKDNSKVKSISISTRNLSQYYSSPQSPNILFEYKNKSNEDSLILKYNINKNNFESFPILRINDSFETYKLFFKKSKGISNYFLSENGRYFSRLQSTGIFNESLDTTYTQNLEIYDFLNSKVESFKLNNFDFAGEFISDMNLSQSHILFYYKSQSSGSGAFSENPYFNIKNGELIENLNSGSRQSEDLLLEPTVIKIMESDESLLYGTVGGQLILKFIKNENFSYEASKLVSLESYKTITALETTEKFFIAGHEDGVLSFYLNPFYEEDEVRDRSGLILVKRIYLENRSPIQYIKYDQQAKKLYIVNLIGEIYILQLNSRIEIPKNKTHAFKDICKLLDIKLKHSL